MPAVDVLDPGGPGVDGALLASLAARPRGARAIVLGGRADADAVARQGLEVLGHVPIPGGVPWLAGPPLGRLLRRLDVEEVATWSEAGLVAAIRAGVAPSKLHAAVVAVDGPPPWLEPWRRDRHAVRPVGFELGPVLFSRGWRPESLLPLADLPVGFASPSLGAVGWADPARLVVGLHAEPIRALDFERMVFAVVAAGVAGRDITIVIPECGTRGRASMRWIAEANPAFSGPDVRVVVDDRMRTPERIAEHVDAVVSVVRPTAPARRSIVSLRRWLSFGVPLIAERSRDTESIVEDGVDGRLVDVDDRHAVTSILVRLAGEPALLAGMRHAAAARHGGSPADPRFRASSPQAGGSASRNRDAASR